MKKVISLILAAAMLLGCLTGCGKANGKTREKVTIALWSDQLTEQYGEFLRDKFPDVDFTFYVATNSADFYRFKNERGDLPDILTVRRFALRDVADWRDALMDLSDTELANTFSPSYLRSYTYDDGTVNWLPVCAEVDSIIVNKTLLEENGIDVPQNYEEFSEACEKLRERGIMPFLSDFDADYTCLEMLQGLSAAELSSQSGREWRQKYESGETDELSEEVWLPVFEKMLDFIDKTGLCEDNLEFTYDDIFEKYENGEAAMIRGTGNEMELHDTEGTQMVMAPFWGASENDNRYLTYPAFQIAASKSAEEDSERKRLIIDILEAMLSEDGLRKIAENQNMVSYSSSVNIDMSPSMDGVRSYAESNRLYIRLASSEMFSASMPIVRGMISGQYPDARSAFDAFNELMAEDKSGAAIAASIGRDYSYEFNEGSGCEAASAVMNSVREELGAELLISPAEYVAGKITKGDYTEEELRFLTMGEGVGTLACEITGEQLENYVKYVLTVREKRGSVINSSTLYVSSGFEMTVNRTENGFELEKLTVNGEPLDKGKIYKTVIIGNMPMMLNEALKAVGIEEYERAKDYKQALIERLCEGRDLAEPSKYITVT